MLDKQRLLLAAALALVLALVLNGAVGADGGPNISSAPLLPLNQTVIGEGAAGYNNPNYRRFWRAALNSGDQLRLTLGYTSGDNVDTLALCLLDPSVDDSTNNHDDQCRLRMGADLRKQSTASFIVPETGLWTIELWECVEFCSEGRWNYSLEAAVASSIQPAIAPSPTTTPDTGADVVVASAGDSYSTALGTQPNPVRGGCARGVGAWPVLMPYAVVNISCAGAHVDALFDSFNSEQPQISHLKAIKPDAVTITIGGNDVGFSSTLRNCYRYNCAQGKLNPNGYAIGQLQPKLTTAYVRMARAVGKAPVLVVKYPRIFPAYPRPIINCGWLNNDERLMLNHMGVELDQVEADAAMAANKQLGRKQVWVVDTQDLFTGHELCSSAAWVFKLTPLCLKDLRCGHPIAAGQEALAVIVSKAIAAHT